MKYVSEATLKKLLKEAKAELKESDYFLKGSVKGTVDMSIIRAAIEVELAQREVDILEGLLETHLEKSK